MILTDFLFCEYAFLDRYGRLCAIGVSHEIAVPRLPIGINHAVIVARAKPEKSDTARKATVGLRISIDGKSAQPESTEGIQFIQQPGYIFIVFRFLSIDIPGRYDFTVLIDNKAAGSLRLPVRVVEPE